jgi:hypothetical protein
MARVRTDEDEKNLIRTTIGVYAGRARAVRRTHRDQRRRAWNNVRQAYQQQYEMGILEWWWIASTVWKLFLVIWKELAGDETAEEQA